MWKFTEQNAYDSISLHDCRADRIERDGNDLLFHFPDGFWITPVSPHIDHDSPLKTGSAMVRVCGQGDWEPLDSVDLYKMIRILGKEILCCRIRLDAADFLNIINDGKHELEFITEYHNGVSALYQCWLWRKDRGVVGDCQLEMVIERVEYCWNDILPDHEW